MERSNKKPKEWSDLPEEVQSMVLPYLNFENLVIISIAMHTSSDSSSMETATKHVLEQSEKTYAISNITAIWDKLSFLEENCPWIKKMPIKMNVLHLNFLPENVPAFLNAIRTMEPFEMRNVETDEQKERSFGQCVSQRMRLFFNFSKFFL
ncbi:unnamed protein product [Caenorhabditis nigoni]